MHSRLDPKFIKISGNNPLPSEGSRSGMQLRTSKELSHALRLLSALGEVNVTTRVHKHKAEPGHS